MYVLISFDLIVHLAFSDRFLFSDGISTGATYPNIGMFNGEETTRILFLAKSTTLQGRCKSGKIIWFVISTNGTKSYL